EQLRADSHRHLRDTIAADNLVAERGDGGDLTGPKGTAGLTPFARDTLLQVIGGLGSLQLKQQSYAAAPVINGYVMRALTNAPLPGRLPAARTVTFYGPPDEHVMAHEAGHILDHRMLAPLVLAAAAQGMDRYKHKSDYFGRDRNEYVAEAFARAILSGRKG